MQALPSACVHSLVSITGKVCRYVIYKIYIGPPVSIWLTGIAIAKLVNMSQGPLRWFMLQCCVIGQAYSISEYIKYLAIAIHL